MLSQLRREKSWSFDARYRRNIKAPELNKEGKGLTPSTLTSPASDLLRRWKFCCFRVRKRFGVQASGERFRARWRLSSRDSWPTPRRAQEFLLFLRPDCSEANPSVRRLTEPSCPSSNQRRCIRLISRSERMGSLRLNLELARCLIPASDGASLSSDSKGAPWDSFYMGALPND
jgi:hypothetical protein